MNVRRTVASSCLILVVLASLLTGCDQKGPDPTVASISATTGPFAITTTTIAAGTISGTGGATIYAPTDTSQGQFGGVAIIPGFIESRSVIEWLGPRIATQGFVVITVDPMSSSDLPAARADDLLAALNYLTTTSAVHGEVDPSRLAVMGHSMGGGGTLEAAAKNHNLKAAIPLAGWDSVKNFAGSVTPTLVVACQSDTIAPPADHSTPFYNSLTSKKAYLEIAGGSHFCPTSPQTTIAKYVISWLKRFVDSDTRYTQFLCPTPAATGDISKYLSNCPYDS